MNKVFFIAKFNEITKQLYDVLSGSFNIHLGSDVRYVIQGFLELDRPDCILISLNGLDTWHGNLFTYLSETYPDIPVICYGTAGEWEPFKMNLESQQFRIIEPSYDCAELIVAIHDILKEPESESMDCAALSANLPETNLSGNNSGNFSDNGDKKTILLIDDEPVMLRAVRALLQDKYKVLMATSGTEALILLGKQIPDLIFLDYNMPVCDGRQTLKMIREFEPAKNVPIVFLTGISDKSHIEMVLRLNPAGYLLKPVKRDTLFALIKEILG